MYMYMDGTPGYIRNWEGEKTNSTQTRICHLDSSLKNWDGGLMSLLELANSSHSSKWFESDMYIYVCVCTCYTV